MAEKQGGQQGKGNQGSQSGRKSSSKTEKQNK